MESIRKRLCALEEHLLTEILRHRDHGGVGDWSAVAEETEADTIFAIDRVSERVILEWFDAHWPTTEAVRLVMEGIPDAEMRVVPTGASVAPVGTVILDPIDGTRNLMYDKRSAWILAAWAPVVEGARLSDLRVAAMTEIPTSKQWRADQLSAIRGGGPTSVRTEAIDTRNGGARHPLPLRPSKATDMVHGFGGISRFFPAGMAWLAEAEEQLWREIFGAGRFAEPLVFSDQYISTGGQIYSICCGHDRFIADLRPEAYAHLSLPTSLVCHPYDICTALIAEEAGCVVCALDGSPVDAPLDTTSPVSWLSFANQTLEQLIRPRLQRILREKFG